MSSPTVPGKHPMIGTSFDRPLFSLDTAFKMGSLQSGTMKYCHVIVNVRAQRQEELLTQEKSIIQVGIIR
jgi:hypothetical protein